MNKPEWDVKASRQAFGAPRAAILKVLPAQCLAGTRVLSGVL
jgi:hypothetical protein